MITSSSRANRAHTAITPNSALRSKPAATRVWAMVSTLGFGVSILMIYLWIKRTSNSLIPLFPAHFLCTKLFLLLEPQGRWPSLVQLWSMWKRMSSWMLQQWLNQGRKLLLWWAKCAAGRGKTLPNALMTTRRTLREILCIKSRGKSGRITLQSASSAISSACSASTTLSSKSCWRASASDTRPQTATSCGSTSRPRSPTRNTKWSASSLSISCFIWRTTSRSARSNQTRSRDCTPTSATHASTYRI